MKRSVTVVAGTSTAVSVREVSRNLIWQKEVLGQASHHQIFLLNLKYLKWIDVLFNPGLVML